MRGVFRFLAYLLLISVGISMAAGWMFFGAGRLAFTIGGLLAAFGLFSFWVDFLLPKGNGR